MHTKWQSAALALALAAGGAPPAEATTDTTDTATDASATTGGDTEDVVPSPPTPWEEMSMDDRRRWMGTEVLPRMAPLFEEHDAERFGGFGCESCHGDDMVDRSFEMPNPGILALHPTGSEEQQQMVQEHPEMVRFMFNRVVPTMQTLLGAPDFDVATGEGFSCYYCHPRGGDEAAAGGEDGEAAASEGDESAFALPVPRARL